MNKEQAAQAYKQASIENAPPIKIVRMLYQGAIRFLDKATGEDSQDPSSRFVEFVGRADDIVSELRLALDPTLADEITSDLERLYLFAEERIGNAQIERSVLPLADARQILVKLLEAWTEVELETTRVAGE
jgi:flagellar protein FliS